MAHPFEFCAHLLGDALLEINDLSLAAAGYALRADAEPRCVE